MKNIDFLYFFFRVENDTAGIFNVRKYAQTNYLSTLSSHYLSCTSEQKRKKKSFDTYWHVLLSCLNLFHLFDCHNNNRAEFFSMDGNSN